MSQLSSDSSLGSDSSEDSIYNEVRKSSDINDFISWNSVEGNLFNFTESFKQYSSDEKIFLLKSRCLAKDCPCTFNTQNILLAKVFVGLKVLIGKWCKLRFSKSSLPDIDKLGSFIFFKDFQGWYEIMNENLDVIPFWNTANQIIQNKPKTFILRKDSKCLILKDHSNDSEAPLVFENMILKSGTVLNFSQCRKYSTKKGRRIKDQNLVQCTNSIGENFYFIPEETVYASPIAGLDNLSGAHAFNTIIEKFHFPINIKPIFMTPPFPNLPCSDRHFLQLTERFQMNLIIVTPIKDSDRLFLITPDLFNDHVFTIGEFLPSSVTKTALPSNIEQHINSLRSKIDKFLTKCHKFDSLSYLLKNAGDISKSPPKFEVSDSEFDEIYIEVEGIYFFIRNGYFPRNSVQQKPKTETPVTVETEQISETSSESSTNDEDDDDEESSSEISSTSTDSDKTTSTAMNLYRRRKNQTRSVPNWKSKMKGENGTCKTSRSRGKLDDGVRKVTEVPAFYRPQVLNGDRINDSSVDAGSLKNTVV